jgi:hypothetical protein
MQGSVLHRLGYIEFRNLMITRFVNGALVGARALHGASHALKVYGTARLVTCSTTSWLRGPGVSLRFNG